MDASTLIDTLLENQRLVSLLATDPYGNPALYQILSPESEVFPRIAVFENDREYTRFADDMLIEKRIEFWVDMYARENILTPLNSALAKGTCAFCLSLLDGGSIKRNKRLMHLVTLELLPLSIPFQYTFAQRIVGRLMMHDGCFTPLFNSN